MEVFLIVASWKTIFGLNAGVEQEIQGDAPVGGGPEAVPAKADGTGRKNDFYGPLEHLGEQNELLHVRFGYMADRLEDLKTLTEDFNLLTKPISEIATELPKAKARIIEVEALLQRETETAELARNQLGDLQRRLAQESEQKTNALAKANKFENAFEKVDEELADLQIAHDEVKTIVETTRKRASLEAENVKRLEAEIQSLNAEVARRSEANQTLLGRINTATERAERAENEGDRLQVIIDQQVQQLVQHQGRIGELEKSGRQQHQAIEVLRTKLASQGSEYEAQIHEQEMLVSALSAEKASFSLKIDELKARVAAGDQSNGQLRAILAERDAAIHTTEEALRTASKSAQAKDREIAALNQSLQDRSAQLGEIKQISDDATKRATMLNKALSGKSAALEVSLEQSQSRADMIEELNQKFANEKDRLSAANRLLLEKLENEKAERTLAQGALRIARESRSWLQKQNEALKRANRALRNSQDVEGAVDPSADEADDRGVISDIEAGEVPFGESSGSNVSHFPSKPKEPND